MPRKKGPNLSVGRGEKQSVRAGGGLTAKGRAKYNRATGSKLKAPQNQGHGTSHFVPEVRAGLEKEAKQQERDGVADEDTKSKTWFVLQHKQTAQGWQTCQEAWSKRLPNSQGI